MTESVMTIDNTARPKERTPKGWQDYWKSELQAAEKRLRDYFKSGNYVVKRYLDAKGRQPGTDVYGHYYQNTNFSLNLFYTNVSTLLAMLYGSKPQIDVDREHQDPDDDVARVAANLYQRILQADVDDSGEDFSTTLKAALQDRLLPGMGTARVRYEMQTTQTAAPADTENVTALAEQVAYENSVIDYVHWQDLLWGWCRTWSECPWIGFRAWLSKEEATARFGEKKARTLEYKTQAPSGADKDEQTQLANQENNVQQAEIWEIWDKKSRKVFWFNAGVELILDSIEDPLRLDGFWPCPRPMMANLTTTMFAPKSDFSMAQDLYNEIDELQTRISIITRAVKVVGVYDAGAGDSVGRMLKEGVENDLIPVDSWAMFAERGGLQGSIDWFPVQDVVATLTTLRQLLGETIQLLYEVTGMSDILRGANTDQYTSDGTNQLKAKFGSIRIQCLQDDFARFASELEALRAEVIAKHYEPRTIMQQANAQFLPQADQQLIGPAIALMKAPDVKWRINIRPESIAMVDYAQLKQERSEFLTAMATYLQSAQAMVQAVPQSMPILLEMLKWGMAGFKGSNYLEGIMDQAIDMAMKTPPQQDNAAQQQAAQQQADLAKIQAKMQADIQVNNVKMQGELQKIQMDHQANMAEQQAKAQADLQRIAADLRADLQVIATKLNADLRTEEQQAAMDITSQETQHTFDMTENAAQHNQRMTEIGAQQRGDDGGTD